MCTYCELNIVVGVIILDQDHDPSMFICAIAIKRGYGLRHIGYHGCSTLRNGQIFKQVIDACQSSAVAVLADCAGLV